MTVFKAFYVRRRNGGPSSRLIQTFLREGVFYYLLISIANLVCHTLLTSPLLIQGIPRYRMANRLMGSSTCSKAYSSIDTPADPTTQTSASYIRN